MSLLSTSDLQAPPPAATLGTDSGLRGVKWPLARGAPVPAALHQALPSPPPPTSFRAADADNADQHPKSLCRMRQGGKRVCSC